MSVVDVKRSRALGSSLIDRSVWLSSVESTECLMKDRKQTWGFLLTSLTEGFSHLVLTAALLLGINHHNHIYTYADYLAPRVKPEIRWSLREFFSFWEEAAIVWSNAQDWRTKKEREMEGMKKRRTTKGQTFQLSKILCCWHSSL